MEDGEGKMVYIDELSRKPLETLEHHLQTFSFSVCHFKQLGNEFAYPSLDRVITCLGRCFLMGEGGTVLTLSNKVVVHSSRAPLEARAASHLDPSQWFLTESLSEILWT